MQQIVLLHRQTEKDMAEIALLTLEAMNAATARAWLNNGHKIFNQITQRLLVMAGLKAEKSAARTDDAKANRQGLFARLVSMGAKN